MILFGKELTLSFVRKYMKLEFIILNEIKQTQKNKYDPFSQTEDWDVHRREYGQSTIDLNEYAFMKAISLYNEYKSIKVLRELPTVVIF